MGYTLKIGECTTDYDEDYVRISCDLVRRDDAPAYGEPTDYENQRWPSYTCWSDAMRTLGLMDVMFDARSGGAGFFEWNGLPRGPLLESHPGATPITLDHVEYVEAKLAEYKASHPDHMAILPPPKPGAKPIDGTGFYFSEDYSDDPKYDGALCRGEWLAYWLRWAIDNCKKPVFVNT